MSVHLGTWCFHPNSLTLYRVTPTPLYENQVFMRDLRERHVFRSAFRAKSGDLETV